MIVRALVRKPKLMLLDEADTHLTPEARSHFVKLLQELKQEGVAVLVASKSKEVRKMMPPHSNCL
jgi:ABC-type multidrug transport system ATPase subunit